MSMLGWCKGSISVSQTVGRGSIPLSNTSASSLVGKHAVEARRRPGSTPGKSAGARPNLDGPGVACKATGEGFNSL